VSIAKKSSGSYKRCWLTCYLSPHLAKDLTLEEIDLLWSDEEFRNTQRDLPILDGADADLKEPAEVDMEKV
jgi:hypothetical protein